LSSLSKRFEYVQTTLVTADEYTFNFMRSNTSLASQKLMGEVLDPGDAPTYIGCEPELGPVAYSFHGSMDDIELYSKALSEAEIQKINNN
jgi:hypothetical protein